MWQDEVIEVLSICNSRRDQSLRGGQQGTVHVKSFYGDESRSTESAPAIGVILDARHDHRECGERVLRFGFHELLQQSGKTLSVLLAGYRSKQVGEMDDTRLEASF